MDLCKDKRSLFVELEEQELTREDVVMDLKNFNEPLSSLDAAVREREREREGGRGGRYS